MLALKLLLTVAGVLLLAAAVLNPLHGLWLRIQYTRRKASPEGKNPDGTSTQETLVEPEEIAWRVPVALALVACLPLLVAGSIVVVPSGMGGIIISQIGGTQPETLYPGMHFITPLVDSVEMFDLRDHLFTAGIVKEGGKTASQLTGLDVQSREGLNIGLGVTVRYRLDPNKLASVQAHLPQPADKELGAASGGKRLARTCSSVHGARNLLNQARRGALQSSYGDYPQAEYRRHRCGRSHAGGHSIARRILEGA